MLRGHDPYDVWAIPATGRLKQQWTHGEWKARLLLPFLGLLEFLSPIFLRRLLGVEKHQFAHVEAMHASHTEGLNDVLLVFFRDTRINGVAWGLPFGWYSKNGFYVANTPYITNTPYVMEALLKLAEQSGLQAEAMDMFHSTWSFLESLKVMFENENDLALSYAPIDEPRIVVNANAYAAFAYALHAVHGKEECREVAKAKAIKISRWVAGEQNDDGSWFYYADKEYGNFIDCFHSCFVVKNLLKVSKLLPELSDFIQPVTDRGWAYIRNDLYEKDSGLCRRFATRAQRDPFRLDLYDQAEYLGLLVDYGLLDEATEFAELVEKKFCKGAHWYCRIDIFGRRWGKGFLRWGIVPFWYHKAKLNEAGNSQLDI